MHKIRMKHDDIDGEIEVLAPAVEHHRRSGWKPVEDKKTEDQPTQAAQPGPVTGEQATTTAAGSDPVKTTGRRVPGRDGTTD